MGSIRVAILETAQCVFGLFWSGCVYDYCDIVFPLTYAAGGGGRVRRLGVGVLAAALNVRVSPLCCKQMAQFFPLTCSLSVILTGVRVLPESLSAENRSVNRKHKQSPAHTQLHNHTCVQCILSINGCTVGYKR